MSQSFKFTLIFEGSEDSLAWMTDNLYEAGFDDALIGSTDGEHFIDVTRTADTLEEAVRSAIDQVNESETGLRVRDVRPPVAKAVSGI